jgi:hypothetical protein
MSLAKESYRGRHSMQCDGDGRKCFMVCDGMTDSSTHQDCKEPTVSAFDHHDGDLTSSITFSLESPSNKNLVTDQTWSRHRNGRAFGDINFNELGTWVVTFKVSDNAGNKNSNDGEEAQDQIYIHIVDNLSPQFGWPVPKTREANCRAGSNKFDVTSLVNTITGDDFDVPKVDGKDPEKITETYSVRPTNIKSGVVSPSATMFKGVSLCPTNKGGAATYELKAKWEDANKLLNDVKTKKCDASRGLYCGVGAPDLKNLKHTVEKTLKIQDTTAPDFDVWGFQTIYVECGAIYNYDDCTSGSCVVGTTLNTTDTVTDAPVVTMANPDPNTLTGKWTSGLSASVSNPVTLSFESKDLAGNVAKKTRTLKWQDTEPPVFAFDGTGSEVCTNGNCAYVKECHLDDNGKGDCAMVKPTCSDVCHSDQSTVKISSSSFDETQLGTTGTYNHDWTCTDGAGNSEKMTVIYKVVSHAVPTMTIVAGNGMADSDVKNYVAASYTGTYTDPGAECSVGTTNLNHVIRTKGQVVDLSHRGDYKIVYTCVNPYNKAKTATLTRTVVVQDNTCPTLSVTPQNGGAAVTCGVGNCGEEITIEAGFPYKDAGASATDDFECKGKTPFSTDVKKCDVNIISGTSTAHFHATDAGHSYFDMMHAPEVRAAHLCTKYGFMPEGNNAKTFCDGDKTYVKVTDAQQKMQFINKATTNCKAAGAGNTCEALNPNWETPSCEEIRSVTNHFKAWGMQGYSGGTFNHYPCKVKDVGQDSHLVWMHEDKDNLAYTGTYYLTFSATDRAGNQNNCGNENTNGYYVRTVIVQDTLPPVITLKTHQDKYLNKENVIKHTGNDVYHHDGNKSPAQNPAYLFPFNPFSLMAEQRSVNGWMVGALASFVAGVALISFSSKSESHSVPV